MTGKFLIVYLAFVNDLKFLKCLWKYWLKVNLFPINTTRINSKMEINVQDLYVNYIVFCGTMSMNYNKHFILFLFTSYFFQMTPKMRQDLPSCTTMLDLKYFSPFNHINLLGFKESINNRKVGFENDWWELTGVLLGNICMEKHS